MFNNAKNNTQKYFTISLAVFFFLGFVTQIINEEKVFNPSIQDSLIDFDVKNIFPVSDLPRNEAVNSTFSEAKSSQGSLTRTSNEETKMKVYETYSQMPLPFEPSNKQVKNDEVRFISRGQGYNLFLSPSKATLALRQSAALETKSEKGTKNNREFQKFGSRHLQEFSQSEKQKYRRTVVEMQIVGANNQAQSSGVEELAGKSNYFIGNDPAKWQTDIANYKRVKFEDVYTGINLEYYGNQRQLEYDFIVQPNADPSQIKLKFNGVKKVSVDKQSGELILKTALGEVRQKNPLVYQTDEATGEKQIIDGKYKVTGKEVGFQLGQYDRTKQLTIDPVVLVYSSFLGGSGFDLANAIEVDGQGNAYIAGYTESVNFPTTAGSKQPAYGGGLYDAFISKFNPAGNQLIYSSYLGGSGREYYFGPLALGLDSAGNAYIGGNTNSKNFPTTPGSFQPQPAAPNDSGDYDIFISKLNPTGSQLVYSSYLGGVGTDWLREIKVDASGNAYLGGHGDSEGLSTPGVIKSSILDGGNDIYIAKINPQGSQKLYFTYLGGSGIDYGYGLAIDGSGNAYVTGETCVLDRSLANNFPTTPGVVQPNFIGGDGNCDSFVSKINATATSLVYSTYNGSSGYDYAWDIAVDSQNNAYIVGGTTPSTNFPTTPNALQTTYSGGGFDAFITKFNSTATARIYSTLIGGNGYEVANALAVDNAGNAYIVGETNSPNFPVVQASQPTLGGTIDAFVLKLNPSGSQLIYSTYHGGENVERGYGIAVDNAGNAYIAGGTRSLNFPLLNPYQPVFGGYYDAFIAKFSDPPLQTYSISGRVTNNGSGVSGVTINLSGAATGQTITDATGFYQFSNLPAGGTYVIAPSIANSSIAPGNRTLTNLVSNLTNQDFGITFCNYSLPFPGKTVSAAGETGNFSVVSNCSLTAVSNVPWIIVTSVTNNVVNFVVQQNYGAVRSGSINVNGLSYTITQNSSQTVPSGEQFGGETCSFNLVSQSSSESLQIVPYTGGSVGSITVNTEANCQWTAVPNKNWINVSTGIEKGPKTISYSVNRYDGDEDVIPRAAEIVVNGRLFTVIQTPQFPQEWLLRIDSTNSPVFTSAGGDGSISGISITREGRWTTCVPDPKATMPNCSPPSFASSWIELPASPGNSGSDEDHIARFKVKSNQGLSKRTGGIVIGDKVYIVTQAGTSSQSSCNFQLPLDSLTVASGINEKGSFDLTVGAGCTWQANSSDPSWLEITGGSGSGNGTVSFQTKSANPGSTPRSATIMVGGKTFRVTQNAGQQPCSYQLAPPFRNVSEGSTAGVVTVTATQSCSWSAVSNAGWLSIVPGTQTGGNNGQLNFVVEPNITTMARIGTITIADQTFTVNQAAGTSSPSGNFAPTLNSLSPQTVFRGTAAFELTINGTNFTQDSVVRWNGQNRPTTYVSSVQLKVQIPASDLQTAGQFPITIFNPSNGGTVSNPVNISVVTSRKQFDFDGDGRADISVFRPDSGVWYLLNSQTGFTGFQFGVSTDKIVPADYDGDGKTDVAVYRGGTWYLNRSSAGFTGFAFGAPDDIPQPADFDGDGKAELAVWRPSNGFWYVYNLATNQVTAAQFGASIDKPAVGDYNGDGKADYAVFRPSVGFWYIARQGGTPAQNFDSIKFGEAQDKPVAADYDGDGKTDVAVFRPSNGTWFLLRSQAGFTGVQFGIPTDLPTPADYDGDGKTDIAVYRNGIWYLLQSTSGFTGIGFGAATDKPAPNAFVP